MATATAKIVQYLDEAHASEQGLTRVLQSQIAMTPRGGHRTALERHLRERTRTPTGLRRGAASSGRAAACSRPGSAWPRP